MDRFDKLAGLIRDLKDYRDTAFPISPLDPKAVVDAIKQNSDDRFDAVLNCIMEDFHDPVALDDPEVVKAIKATFEREFSMDKDGNPIDYFEAKNLRALEQPAVIPIFIARFLLCTFRMTYYSAGKSVIWDRYVNAYEKIILHA